MRSSFVATDLPDRPAVGRATVAFACAACGQSFMADIHSVESTQRRRRTRLLAALAAVVAVVVGIRIWSAADVLSGALGAVVAVLIIGGGLAALVLVPLWRAEDGVGRLWRVTPDGPSKRGAGHGLS